ncbi:hypothetical protein K3712_000533 [Escherichia coli]|nr:hypothetical protein [Escherichia coli]
MKTNDSDYEEIYRILIDLVDQRTKNVYTAITLINQKFDELNDRIISELKSQRKDLEKHRLKIIELECSE